MYRDKYRKIIDFIKVLYKNIVPLNEPIFLGNEEKYVLDTNRFSYVSSIGEYVNKVEKFMAEFTDPKCAIAIVNGTSSLHIALLLSGVKNNTEAITQLLTFVATCNLISYFGAYLIFVDVNTDTLGMSPEDLESFLVENCLVKDDGVYNKLINRN